MHIGASPLKVYPQTQDKLVQGPGWGGVNQPIKARDDQGDLWVAKTNTLGAYAAILPGHDSYRDDVAEIVASHIVADEFCLPTITFQEGLLIREGQSERRNLSRYCPDFQTLEQAPVAKIKDGDQAVTLTMIQGCLLGDFDSTFNDSNAWVGSDGRLMGSDYGFALQPGIQAKGIPFANLKVMRQFATPENVQETSERILGLSDRDLQGMVQRQGQAWVSDWNHELEQDFTSALIHNRDQLQQSNPYLKFVQGWHPEVSPACAQMRYPFFVFEASGAVIPWGRPDQALAVAKLGASRHLKWPSLFSHHPQKSPPASGPSV